MTRGGYCRRSVSVLLVATQYVVSSSSSSTSNDKDSNDNGENVDNKEEETTYCFANKRTDTLRLQ